MKISLSVTEADFILKHIAVTAQQGRAHLQTHLLSDSLLHLSWCKCKDFEHYRPSRWCIHHYHAYYDLLPTDSCLYFLVRHREPSPDFSIRICCHGSLDSPVNDGRLFAFAVHTLCVHVTGVHGRTVCICEGHGVGESYHLSSKCAETERQ